MSVNPYIYRRSARGAKPFGLPPKEFFEDASEALHQLNDADKHLFEPVKEELETAAEEAERLAAEAAAEAAKLAAEAAAEAEKLAKEALDAVGDAAGEVLGDIAGAAGSAVKPILIPLVEIGIVAILGLIIFEKLI